MAPRKPSNTNGSGTEVVDWEAQMAADADVAAGSQRASGGGGKFLSLRAGVLSFDGNPMPGNQMAVIILADTMENSYYDGAFDPDTPASPKCFAFAKSEDDLEPHTAVDNDPYFERQHDQCAGCPMNEWGSASTGKGKACKNVMRLAMIPAGQYVAQGKGRSATYELETFDDPDHFADAEVVYLKLPVMSVKNYGAYVKQVAGELRRPPHGVLTNIYLEPDPKSQFKVMFEVIDKVDAKLLPVIMPRHKITQDSIDFAYSPPMAADEAKPQPSASKLTKKPAAKTGRR